MNEETNEKSIIKKLSAVLSMLGMVISFIGTLLGNNTFEIEIKTSEVPGLGNSYTSYEIITEPTLANAKMGIQAYIEIIYDGKMIGRILVNDLYGNRAYQMEKGKISITCRSTELKELIDNIKKEVTKRYGLEENKLQIKQDTILGFRYTILHQNFEIPRYFRLNTNNPLHISKREALCTINSSESTNILAEGNLDDLSETEFEKVIQLVGKAIFK